MKKNQFRRKVTALTMAAMLTLLGAQAAFAESRPLVDTRPYDPSISYVSIVKSFEVKGIVEYQDVEGGYYTVDGWRLIGDQAMIELYAGQTVFVEGHEFDGVSIFMNQALVVSAFTPISADGERGEKRIVGVRESAAAPKSFEVKGIVEKIDLEGGFYALDGWRLIGDRAMIERFLGKTVFVLGAESTDPSIYMTQGMVVESITSISAAGDREETYVVKPIFAPVSDLTFTGTLEYSDLEGGFYTVNGYGLIGTDVELLKGLLGTTVTVHGALFDGVSIYNTTMIEVDSVKPAVARTWELPNKVVVDGKDVQFDQQPVLVGGTLMVPLRFVVEAAGGTVTWMPVERAVNVRLNDRTATFVIGEDQAEMNQDGHYYLVRNMLKMEHAPVIEGDRTLISADALHTVLGLFQSVSDDSSSDLKLVK